mgnify:FL=1
MAKLKDKRNWQEEYNNLKINFDRLDRMNDVLYRYWYTINRERGCTVQEMADANKAVKAFLEELSNECKEEKVVP